MTILFTMNLGDAWGASGGAAAPAEIIVRRGLFVFLAGRK